MSRTRRRKEEDWLDRLPRPLRQALGYVFFGAVGILFGRWVVLALMTGETSGRRGGTVFLSEDPITFWMSVAWNSVILLCCLFLLLRAAMADHKRLMASRK